MAHADELRALVAHHGTPLLVVDCDVVRRQYQALRRALPKVELYYALKPLPHPAVVATLKAAGASFDVATTTPIVTNPPNTTAGTSPSNRAIVPA